MLELLADADVNPSVFYSLRGELSNILNTTTLQANLNIPTRRIPFDSKDFRTSPALRALEIPPILPQRVLSRLEFFSTGIPEAFQRGLDRSHRYMPYIREQLRKNGLPEELAWLAIVESNFQENVTSRSGAGGMWQFMPRTGNAYGLRIDGYVDERFDWKKSTHSAIEYLKTLYEFFDGSWPLALSGYNMGENGLERRIQSTGGERDFWRLIEMPGARIPRETRDYYPKFIAAVMIGSDPTRFGFKVNATPPVETTKVAVKGSYALEALDEELGYKLGTLARLNPDLLNQMTPPTGTSHALTVPAEDRSEVLAALKKIPAMKYGTGTHKVRRGETISEIATRYNVSQRELMGLNGVRNARSLRAGQTLRLPGFQANTRTRTTSAAPSATGTYTVKRNDTLSVIAATHRVSVRQLQLWNNMGKRTTLQIGQKLRVKGTTQASPQSASYHIVRSGEYPAKIALQNGIKLNDLLALNNLTRSSTIYVGQRLIVRSAKATTPTSTPPRPTATTQQQPPNMKKITHTVVAGDSAYIIGRKYGVKMNDVLRWNKLTSKSVLQLGDTCIIYVPDESAPTAQAQQDAPPEPTRAAKKSTTHKVTNGQNPSTIAKRYRVKVNDLFKWNNWKKGHVLHIGDEVLIYTN
jgi:membrane-bound lytic murein transglycosylase D